MTRPTEAELHHHVGEVGWSLVSLAKHLLTCRVADRNGRTDAAQAAFDGAVLHLRALVEFLVDDGKGGHVKATHYYPGWDGHAAATARNFDVDALITELNVHAAHLSRQRFSLQPSSPWDAYPRAEQVFDLFDDLVNCTEALYQQELYEQLCEARTHWVLIAQVR